MGRVPGSKLLFCFTEQGVAPESRCCFPGACKSQNDLDKIPVLAAAAGREQGTGTSAADGCAEEAPVPLKQSGLSSSAAASSSGASPRVRRFPKG